MGLLGAAVLDGVHLAEVPLDAEEDVTAHDQAAGVFLVIGGDGVCQVAGLVQDVVDGDVQVEGADVLVDFGIPLPFGLAVTRRIAFVESIGQVRVEYLVKAVDKAGNRTVKRVIKTNMTE